MNVQTIDQKRTGKDQSVIAGWICFIIGIFLMFFSLGLFFIYGPLFLTTFILSIIGIAKGRILSGILLLLATFIIPTIFWIVIFSCRFSGIMVEQDRNRKQTLAHLSFEDVSSYTSGNYMYLEGKIRNNGNMEVEYIKVAVEWLDETGIILDNDWTYAVAGEGLKPDAAKSFQIMSRRDTRMKRYKYYLMDD